MMCQACRGRGKVEHRSCKGTGRDKGGTLGEWDRGECQGCQGTGFIICQACGGTGQVGKS